jgi:hypothetical protein
MRKWFTVFVNDQGQRFIMPPRRHFRLTGPFWGIVLALSEGCVAVAVLNLILSFVGFVGLPILIGNFVPDAAVAPLLIVAYIEWFFWFVPEASYQALCIWLRLEAFVPVALVLARCEVGASNQFNESFPVIIRDMLNGVVGNSESSVFLPIMDRNNNYYNHVLNGIARDQAFR